MNIRLVGYEFRKNFLNRATVLIVLALLILNGWKICDVRERKSVLSESRYENFEKVYWELYDKFSGTITAEKITELLGIYRPIDARAEAKLSSNEYDPDSYTYNDYTDEIFFERCYVEEMEYDYLYQNYAYGIVTRARDNLEFYGEWDNTYEYEKNQQLIDLFEGRKITEFVYTEGYYFYLFYDFSVILVLFICVFAMAGVFVMEKETEMYLILNTSRKGGMATTAAKLTASMVFVTLICLLFWVEDYLMFGIRFGSFEAARLPLYGIPAFRNTPLQITVGQFSVLISVIKTLGIMGCSLIFLCFSSFSKKVLPPFLAGIVASLLMIYLQGRSVGNLLLKWINPMELVIGRDLLMGIRFVDLFGHSVLIHKAVITGILILMAVFALVLVWKNRIRRKGGGKR